MALSTYTQMECAYAYIQLVISTGTWMVNVIESMVLLLFGTEMVLESGTGMVGWLLNMST